MDARILLLGMIAAFAVIHCSPSPQADESVTEDIGESDWEPVESAEGEPLADEQLEALLSRLPDLEEREEDEVEFRRRPDSPPPPRPGEDIDEVEQWPPDLSDPAPQESPDGPLVAQAFRPEGEIEPPFQLAIAFDRPVVEVGAVGTQQIPEQLELAPEPDGRWRWLGTQTIVFEPEDRWPMATEYEVTLTEGLEAIDGSRLEEQLSFEFSTPPAEVQRIEPDYSRYFHHPAGVDKPADQPVAVVFDQPIDPASAESISVRENRGEMPMERLEGEEFDEVVRQLGVAGPADEDRVIALAPARDFERGARVRIHVEGPLASKDGPVVGMADDSASFRVYDSLRLVRSLCGFGGCQPGSTVRLEFTNQLDVDADEIDVEVQPELEDLSVSVSGAHIHLRGDFEPRTGYSLTVPRELTDEFGQQLEGSRNTGVSIGAQPPFFAGPDRHMVVRPPEVAPTLPVMAAELEQFRARVYRVEPDDWEDFQDYRRRTPRREVDDNEYEYKNFDEESDAELVDETIIEIPRNQRQQASEQIIDISEALDDEDRGHAVVVVDQPHPWRGATRRAGPQWNYWVQRSNLILDASDDRREAVAQVRRVSDGVPVQGAAVVTRDADPVTTDRHGEASVGFGRHTGRHAPPVLVRHGADTLVVPANEIRRPRRSSRQGLWYVVDDRQMYKPGETVQIRGWVRTRELRPDAGPQDGVHGDGEVRYSVRGSRRNDIADGAVDVDEFGGFEFEFEIPEDANLGTATVSLRSMLGSETARSSSSSRHTIEIQEFRRPEYEVDLETGAGPHLVGDQLSWDAEATYYAGGAVSGADISWQFEEQSASFSPPGWQGWSFGGWSPPWWWSPRSDDGEGGVLPERYDQSIERQTDAAGTDEVSFRLEEPDRGFVRRIEGTVSVEDVDRQAWEAADSVVVHPASTYVGLRGDARFISRGESIEFDAVAVDIDGQIAEGRDIDIEIRRRGDDDPVDRCSKTSEDEPVSCRFEQMGAGRWQAVASVEDTEGRVSESELNFWVSGRDRSGTETAEEDELLLIPDADEYAPGDTAELMVQAPHYPIEAVVELQRDGRYDRRRVTLTADDPVVAVDIEEEMIPNVHVQISAVGEDDAWDPEYFASGSIELNIQRRIHELDVDIRPEADQIAPGDQLHTTAQVTDAQGEPVENAQLLVWGVDESVLALSDYELSDPLSAFYPSRPAGVTALRTFDWLLMDDTDGWDEQDAPGERADVVHQESALGTLAAGEADEIGDAEMARGRSAPGDDAADPIEIREVFDALAFFRSDLITDDQGRVALSEQMPDSLTRYRVMAVAVADDDTSFGTGETDVTARKPLMVSPSAPRFANVGDEFELPVVVHNQTDEDKVVEVGVRATGGLTFTETPGARVEIPADDRLEVQFSARALSAGDTRIQTVVNSRNYDDAELVELPILTPATTEAFATYGTIDAEDDNVALEGLQVPEDAFVQYGGLEVSTSSTQLQALTDAFIYLFHYEFSSSSTLASRILSVTALYDVLDAFDTDDLPGEHEVDAHLELWVERLQELQHRNGGFGFWENSREANPYTSVHATHSLWRADQEGVDVPGRMLQNARRYLSQIDQHIDFEGRAAASLEAYALQILDRMGSDVSEDVQRLVTRYGIEELPLEAVGRILPLADEADVDRDRLLQRLTNQVQETAATAEFQETYDAFGHRILHTTRRTDGVVLAGLIEAEPDHPLIDKVVRGLLAHRERGRWRNTQENVFILLALRSYFDEYEDVDPDFVAGVWLGDDQIGEHEFAGRTTERYNVDVPMQHLVEGDDRWPVIFERDGDGRMYYRLGVDYAPRSTELPADDQGFSVERIYEPVDDDDDVQRTDDGWEIRAGARVRVELSMAVPARRHHVALVDWLPAGFEPLNPALATTSVDDVDTGASSHGWFGWPWYVHQNMRDERVEAFATQISAGTYTYSYVARATTPGQFRAMPAKAEEMYHPETFGRSASETVRVVDR